MGSLNFTTFLLETAGRTQVSNLKHAELMQLPLFVVHTHEDIRI